MSRMTFTQLIRRLNFFYGKDFEFSYAKEGVVEIENKKANLRAKIEFKGHTNNGIKIKFNNMEMEVRDCHELKGKGCFSYYAKRTWLEKIFLFPLTRISKYYHCKLDPIWKWDFHTDQNNIQKCNDYWNSMTPNQKQVVRYRLPNFAKNNK